MKMFPELEAKIEQMRRDGSHQIPMMLGLLSKAEHAMWDGDEERAHYIVQRAMKV